MSGIGFMQGRLSPMVDGRIQSFPWSCWRDEFEIAERCGLRMMEWTLDQDRLYENPLLTAAGRAEITLLCERHGISIPSLTGDCFMQAPLWKARGSERDNRERDFLAVAHACAELRVSLVVVPLVDNGRLDNDAQTESLLSFLVEQARFLSGAGLRMAFESDFGPWDLARFIERLDPACFGINYDIGNSAALGFEPGEEIAAYGQRILNVHVKDRVLGGTTVPLGEGNADFDVVFSALASAGYAGNYILQTARAVDDNHAGVLCRYRDMTAVWVNGHRS